MLKKYILFYLIPVFLYSQSKVLNLEQCIEIALKNNPQIQVAEGSYEAVQSAFVSSRSAYLPQISLQTSAIKNGGTFLVGPISRAGDYKNYSLGFSAQQLLFDFGKTLSRISASSDLADASFQDFKSVQQTIILNTNITYYNYLQSKRILDVSKEIVSQSEEHLKHAQGFFNVGKKPQFDVVKAEADLENTKLTFIRAENAVKIAKIQLENALGEKLSDDIQLSDNLAVSKMQEFKVSSALEEALKNRPDVMASRIRIEANKSMVTSAWTSHLPSINITSGISWKGYELSQKFSEGWNLGLNLSFPIFQGWSLDAGVQQAKANLKATEAYDQVLLQSVSLDVQQQLLSMNEAFQRIEVAQKLIKQSEEAFKLAEGRYRSDVGSAVEITDARVSLSNAKITYIQSLYDYQIAFARLKRAIGTIDK